MNSYGLIDWLLDRLINWFIDWSIETHTFYLVCVSERTSFTCLFREMLACDVIVTSCHRLCTAIVSVYGKCSTRQKKKDFLQTKCNPIGCPEKDLLQGDFFPRLLKYNVFRSKLKNRQQVSKWIFIKPVRAVEHE